MHALSRCLAAGLCLAGIILLTFATLFEPKSEIASSTVVAWATASLSLTALGWLSLKGTLKAFRDLQELGASILFERQLQPKSVNHQELLYARKVVALSQRYSRPLLVVGISWAPGQSRSFDNDNLRSGLDQHLTRFRILKALDLNLRSSDAIVPTRHPTRCFVVCPETSSEEAIGFCNRARSILDSVFQDAQLAFAVAAFETDGYALEDLLERCDERLDRAPLTAGDLSRQAVIHTAGVAAE